MNMKQELQNAGYKFAILGADCTLADGKEFWIELAAKINEIANRKPTTWTAIARYDRGLGVEFVNFRLSCHDITLAQYEAEKLAAKFFEENKGYEKAVIKEVRVRPDVATERKN